MSFEAIRGRWLPIALWGLALLAAVLWVNAPKENAGWDLQVYQAAMHSVRVGHDPYEDGMAVQRVFHAQHHPVTDAPPFTYVYSPLTLPLVRLAGALPGVVSGGLYWMLYGLAVIAEMWVCLQMVRRRERFVFMVAGPGAVFLPGLLENDVIFSGNIAYILHGMALLAAYFGWKRGDWRWFYVVVLFASCFKAPMLYLLAIPVLSAYRQWRPAVVTGAAGLGLFAVQALVWPATFRHYLEAVELQFSYNHDFSSSPAGVLADALYYVIPYKITSGVFYVFYASLFFGVLFYLSRTRFLGGRISMQQWVPFLLVGVLLLNPRIMEYDIGPVTIAMMLVCWRFLARGTTVLRAAFVGAWLLGALNMAAPRDWRATECVVLVCLFAAGAWDVLTDEPAERVPGPAHVSDAGRRYEAINA